MNEKMAKGNWNKLKGKIQEEWGDLTDDDFDKAGGDVKQLIGNISERYGAAKEKVEEKINQFMEDTEGYAKKIPQQLEKIQQNSSKTLQQHPLATLGLTALAGVVFGFLLAKR